MTGSSKRFGKGVGDGALLGNCRGAITIDGELSGVKGDGEVTRIGGGNQVVIIVD